MDAGFGGYPGGMWSLGLVLPTFPQGAPDFGRLPDVARRAEEMGVAGLWACDHLFWPGPVLECFTALTVAAAHTRGCTLGSAVLQLPMRSPAAVAKTAASLQAISGGRLVLGVGAGIHEGEFAAAGADFHRRGRLLDDGIAAVRRHWSAPDGPYAQQPAPAPIPVWVGGTSDAARRRAARTGDGWIPMFLSPDGLAAAYARLAGEAAEHGRDAAAITRAFLVFVSVGPRDEARRRGLAWMSSLYRLPEERLARHLVAGEPAACLERLAEYGAAGAEHLVCFVADDDPLPHLEALTSVKEMAG